MLDFSFRSFQYDELATSHMRQAGRSSRFSDRRLKDWYDVQGERMMALCEKKA
jgi:hypothetical protein